MKKNEKRLTYSGRLLWTVTIKEKHTGEIIKLHVTGETNFSATSRCSGLFGYTKNHEWISTEPAYNE